MKRILFYCLLCFSIDSYSQNWQNLKVDEGVEERHENALVLAGEKFYLIGGRGKKQLDIYDTKSQNWSKGSQPPFEIHHFQAVALDGLIYVLGAFTGGWPYETPLSHILIYDPEADVWIIGGEIPQNRRRGAAGVSIYNQKIYISNGIINGHSSAWVNWLDEFDPYTNTWKSLPDAPRARDHFQSIVKDDKLFVAGGRRSGSITGNGFAGTVKETDVFDFSKMQWETLADIPTPRAGTATAVFDGKPVILGGESNTQEAAHSEVEIFDAESNSWSSLPEMKESRHGTQAISLNNQIVIGAGSGNRGGGPELNSFEILSEHNKPDFKLKPLKKGKLVASPQELVFKENAEVLELEISNIDGNQALILSYILPDNGEFEIKSAFKTPLIIAPGESIKLEIRVKDAKPGEANLIFKSPGQEPRTIKLKRI